MRAFLFQPRWDYKIFPIFFFFFFLVEVVKRHHRTNGAQAYYSLIIFRQVRMSRKPVDISRYNSLINFRPILLAILGQVVPNRRAGIRQYTPSVSIFALRFFSGKKV